MAAKKAIFKSTTEIPVQRSVGGILDMLAAAGAVSINQEFSSGQVSAIRFSLAIGSNIQWFDLPCRIEPILKLIKGQQSYRSRKSDADLREQAARVAWRQLYAWVEAQLAMIQTQMVRTDEVFFPYLCSGPTGPTMFSAYLDAQKLLPAPKEAK
jgi:hypothetical protein